MTSRSSSLSRYRRVVACLLVVLAAGALAKITLAVSTGAAASASAAVYYPPESQSGTVPAGGSITTDTELDGATATDPVETTVKHPAGGDLSISEGAAAGIEFLGQRVLITATPSASAANPLEITFLIDSSIIPAGDDATTITVYKDGVTVLGCTGPAGTASPNPCTSARQTVAGGDASITVLTSAASAWDFASANPPTAVRVVAFTARRTASGVVLRWRTASEAATLGFNVYRSGGGRTLKLTRTMIQARAAGSAAAATYRLLDRNVRRGVTYTYRLRIVNTAGTPVWAASAFVRR